MTDPVKPDPVKPLITSPAKVTVVVDKKETPLEVMQRVIKEYNGIVSDIPVNHPEFWDAKARLNQG